MEEKTDEVCPNCGKPMVIKQGRFGKFMACSGWPECKTAKPLKNAAKEIGMKCPKCAETSPEDQGEIVMKKNQKRPSLLRLFPLPQMRLRLLEKSLGKNPEMEA